MQNDTGVGQGSTSIGNPLESRVCVVSQTKTLPGSASFGMVTETIVPPPEEARL